MRKLLILLALLVAPAAYSQSYYSLDPPAPNANFRMCAMPTAGPPPNPCVTPASIFNDQTLLSPAPNPTPLGPSGTFGFWVASGQYVIQLSGSVSRTIIVSIGGGTVTGVTATLPITVSGTTAPVIACPTCTKTTPVPNTIPSAGQVLVGNAGGTAYAPVSLSGDCTLASTGAITCASSAKVIASGTQALGTSAINSAACATTVTVTATGALTTDNVTLDFTTDPTGITGYAPTVNGILTIYKWLTADTINIKVCNMTAGSITPGAATLAYRVVR